MPSNTIDRTGAPLVKAVNVHKSFGHVEVLKGVDLEVFPGEVVVLLGPSGSGKTTFLRLINQMETLTGGRIWVGGELIGYEERPDGRLQTRKDADIARQRSRIGMVFQRFNLFPHKTALENITEGQIVVSKKPKAAAIERAEDLLRQVGLSDRGSNYPGQLSGGQQQRVAIARALAMVPELMLFDEPTSALDPIATASIEELVTELKKKVTILIVTHNMQQAARVSDYTAYMYLGELVEFGQTDHLFFKPKKKETEDYITGRFG